MLALLKVISNKNKKGVSMKKKFKFIASVASLCLAVAMMTIGVIAAQQVTFNVTSNVTFSASSVFMGFEGKVERATTDAFTGAEVLAQTGTDEARELKNFTDGTSSTGDPISWTPTGLTFEEGKQFVRYTITVNNYSDFGVTVTVGGTITATSDDCTVTPSTAVGGTFTIAAGTIEAPTAGTWTLTLALNNVAKEATIQVNPTFSVAKTVAP